MLYSQWTIAKREVVKKRKELASFEITTC